MVASECRAEPSTSIGGGTLPKLLYHGTTSKHLMGILQSGLRPRGRRKSNWDHYPSRGDMVYLTTAYAPYFAVTQLDEGEQGVIVEVATDKLNPTSLYPDEDFIAQAMSHQTGLPLAIVHKRVRRTLHQYQHHTCDSVHALGNAAHKGVIPPEAITRYATIDGKLQSSLFWIALDPCISVLNYRFMGPKYRSIIAWIMGDRPDFDADGFGNQSLITQMNPYYVNYLRSMWANRDGITVTQMGVSNE